MPIVWAHPARTVVSCATLQGMANTTDQVSDLSIVASAAFIAAAGFIVGVFTVIAFTPDPQPAQPCTNVQADVDQ